MSIHISSIIIINIMLLKRKLIATHSITLGCINAIIEFNEI